MPGFQCLVFVLCNLIEKGWYTEQWIFCHSKCVWFIFLCETQKEIFCRNFMWWKWMGILNVKLWMGQQSTINVVHTTCVFYFRNTIAFVWGAELMAKMCIFRCTVPLTLRFHQKLWFYRENSRIALCSWRGFCCGNILLQRHTSKDVFFFFFFTLPVVQRSKNVSHNSYPWWYAFRYDIVKICYIRITSEKAGLRESVSLCVETELRGI